MAVRQLTFFDSPTNPNRKNCRRCGVEFRVKPSHYDKKSYCGVKCMTEDYRVRMAGADNPNFRDAERRTCLHCGAEFRSYGKERRYCSRQCGSHSPVRRELYRLRRKPVNYLASRRAKSERKKKLRRISLRVIKLPAPPAPPRPFRRTNLLGVRCAACWRKFLIMPSQLGKKTTCSERCRRVAISDRQKGERSHLWKGGRMAEAMIIRTSAEYADWRSAVFTRDNFTCVLCGVRGKRLAAHHIRLFSEHADLRLAVANGVTLCWPCHGGIKCKEHKYEAEFARYVTARG